MSTIVPASALRTGDTFTMHASPFPAARWTMTGHPGMVFVSPDGDRETLETSSVVANSADAEWGSVVLDGDTMVTREGSAYRPEMYAHGWHYPRVRHVNGRDVTLSGPVNLRKIPRELPMIGETGEPSGRMNGHTMVGIVTGYRERYPSGGVYAETRQSDAWCVPGCGACAGGEALPDW